MRIRMTVTGDRHPEGVDVMVDAPIGSTIASVVPRLAAITGAGDETVWNGSRLLPLGALLGGPGLRAGTMLGIGRPVAREPDTTSLLRLAVVGGPSAGRSLALERGLHTVGRGDECDLRLNDDDVSRCHLEITVTAGGVAIRDLDSTNGTWLDDRSVGRDGAPLAQGVLVRLGCSTLELRAGDDPPPALRPTDDGRVLVVRGPRIHPTGVATDEIALPAPPPERGRPAVQWVGALLPAVAGLGLAWVLHTWQFLAFAALTPLTVLGTAAGDRWSWRRGRRRAHADYTAAVRATANQRTAALAREEHERRRAHQDAAATVRTATGPGGRLWERRADDADALTVRVGTATRPSMLQMRHSDGRREAAGTVAHVPVVAALREGPLGLAGDRAALDGLVRALVLQLATAHSPADVSFVVLLSDGGLTDWTWAQWLPHTVRLAATASARADTLAAIEQRLSRAADRSPPDSNGDGWTVLVIDRIGVLAEHPTLARILRCGNVIRHAVICIDDHAAGLPNSCASLAVLTGETKAHLRCAGTGWWPQLAADDSIAAPVADIADSSWADRAARALAPLADQAATTDEGVPARVSWRSIQPTSAFAGWEVDPHECANLRIPIGVGSTGIIELDLSADGPHALVAGTTGSGKSELLQTLVASLARHFPPDDVALLLVDYKGGAAFGACASLPHTVGLVTDLDPHLTRRVLRSLDAELQYRERLLAADSVADLGAYRRLGRRDPLPRLIIVVDEFATLAADLPDFVPGLVDVAQRGRSLGVHLVLATQRPGGVVSPEIRANTSLRIALRTTSSADSIDVIGTADAAAVAPDRPGRAFIRTGTGLFEVQTARVTAAASTGPPRATVTPDPAWSIDVTHSSVGGATDLDELVNRTRQEWEQRRATGLATGVRVPWLPPLPARLEQTELEPVSETGRLTCTPRLEGESVRAAEHPVRDRPMAAIGRIDLPDVQLQCSDSLDLAAGGTVLLVGAPRSGRTAALRTIVQAATGRPGAAVVIVDAGGGLAQVASDPSVYAYVRTRDVAAVARLIELLATECTARRSSVTVCADGSASAITQDGRRVAPLLLLIDGWESVVAATGDFDAGGTVEVLLGICRDAAAVGLTVVIAGDRTLLTPRVLSVANRTYALRLADRSDYAILGVAPAEVPAIFPPGRAVVVPGSIEMQFALPVDPSTAAGSTSPVDPSTPADSTGPVSRPQPYGTLTALRLRPLPAQVDVSALALPPTGWLAFGLGGDTADTVFLDPWAGAGRLLIAGPPRSGRSGALVRLAQAAFTDGATVLCAARTHSPLTAWVQARGGSLLSRDRPSLAGPDRAGESWVAPTAGHRAARSLLLLDDSEDLSDSPLGDAIVELLRRSDPGVAVVCSGRPDSLALAYRGVVAEVRRAHRGLLLRPGPGDGDLIGIRTGRSILSAPPGRGVLVADAVTVGTTAAGGETIAVQVACAESFGKQVAT